MHRFFTMTLLTLSLCLASFANASQAALIVDDFADGTINPTIFQPQTVNVNGGDTAAFVEINERLEAHTTVTVSESSVKLGLQQTPLQSQSWTLQVDAFLDGPETQYPGIGANDVISMSLFIEPSGPGSTVSGDDRAEMNFAFVDSTLLSPPLNAGFQHAVRFHGRTNGIEDEGFNQLGSTGSRSVTMQIAYDSNTSLITGSVNTGSGLAPLGNAVDTSLWGMDPGETFLIQLESNLGNLSPGGLSFGSFATASGQAYFDNFSLDIQAVPEPGTWALMTIGLLGLIGWGWKRNRS